MQTKAKERTRACTISFICVHEQFYVVEYSNVLNAVVDIQELLALHHHDHLYKKYLALQHHDHLIKEVLLDKKLSRAESLKLSAQGGPKISQNRRVPSATADTTVNPSGLCNKINTKSKVR